jgi:multiple sugar transport system substrate-binding protein
MEPTTLVIGRSSPLASRRRVLLGALSLGTAAPLLQACAPAGGGPPAAPGQPAGAGGVALNVLYSSNFPADHDVFVQVFKLFQDKYPGITLDAQDAPGTDVAAQKASTLLAAGTPPDVMWLHPSWVLTFIRAKQLRDLTDLAKDDKSAYLPGQLDFWSDRGRLYGLPYNSNPSILFYNKSLFQKRGVKTPEDYEKAGTWTWDALREVAKLVTVSNGPAGSGPEATFGWDVTGAAGLQFYTCVPVWDNRGELINKEETAWLFDTAPVMEVMQWHADLYFKDQSGPAPSDTQGVNLFNAGRLGLTWGGKHLVIGLLDVSFEIGHVGTPKGQVGPINRDGPLGFGLPAGGKAVPQAYQLARFVGSPEAAPIYLGTGRGLPVQKALVNSPYFLNALKPFERAEVYAAASGTVRAWRVPGQAPQENAAIAAEWGKVLTGEQSVSQAMQAAKRTMDPLLK